MNNNHKDIHITKYNGKYRIYINSNDDDKFYFLAWHKSINYLNSRPEGYIWHTNEYGGSKLLLFELTFFEFDTQEEAEKKIKDYLETINIKPLKTYTFEDKNTKDSI